MHRARTERGASGYDRARSSERSFDRGVGATRVPASRGSQASSSRASQGYGERRSSRDAASRRGARPASGSSARSGVASSGARGGRDHFDGRPQRTDSYARRPGSDAYRPSRQDEWERAEARGRDVAAEGRRAGQRAQRPEAAARARSASRASARRDEGYAFGEAPWHAALPSSSQRGPFSALTSFVDSLSLPQPVALAVPIVAIILIIVLAVSIVGAVQSCTAPAVEEEAQPEAPQPLVIDYMPSVESFDSLADPGEEIAPFTLAAEGSNYVPTLDDSNRSAIQAALDVFAENDRTIGFVFIDLESGSGYSYNIDEKVYGASSFKGPVFIYGCQEALEPGTLSMSTVNSMCENAIVWSDNRSYYQMRSYFEDYGDESLETWLANMNISSSLANDTSFPHYCARDSIKLWMNTYLYFESDESTDEIVSWAQDFFSSTEVSMIRAGVDPAAGDAGAASDGELSSSDEVNGSTEGSDETNSATDDAGASASADATGDASADSSSSDAVASGDASSNVASVDATSAVTVYDKAGWINGAEDDALCDAGIIVDGEKVYLMSIMTSVPDSEDNQAYVADLAAAIWGARSTLMPAEGMITPTQAQQAQGDEGSGEAAA